MKKTITCVIGSIFFISICTALSLPVSPAFAASTKPIELKYSVTESAQAARFKHGHAVWAKMVEKATNGKVKMTLFPSGSLAAPRQEFDATVNGIVDIGYMPLPYYPGRFPLTESLMHPGSNLLTPRMASDVAMKMYQKYPQMQKEFRQVKFLFMYGFAPISVATLKKPVRNIEDVKGMRLRVAQKGISDLLKLSGASPMFIKPHDIFLNLQKGVIDGSVMGWSGHRAFGTNKLAKYFTVVPAFPGPFFLWIMNQRKWDSLPADVQEGLMSVSGEVGSRLFAKSADKETEISTKDLRENPEKEIITISTEQVRLWTEASKPVQDKMISKLESKGLPGKQFFEDVANMVQAYNQ